MGKTLCSTKCRFFWEMDVFDDILSTKQIRSPLVSAKRTLNFVMSSLCYAKDFFPVLLFDALTLRYASLWNRSIT